MMCVCWICLILRLVDVVKKNSSQNYQPHQLALWSLGTSAGPPRWTKHGLRGGGRVCGISGAGYQHRWSFVVAVCVEWSRLLWWDWKSYKVVQVNPQILDGRLRVGLRDLEAVRLGDPVGIGVIRLGVLKRGVRCSFGFG